MIRHSSPPLPHGQVSSTACRSPIRFNNGGISSTSAEKIVKTRPIVSAKPSSNEPSLDNRTRVVLPSLSAAMDGGFTAIADVSRAMSAASAADDYRLIGGVAVMLHILRLGLDLPLRATGDADFGVPPHVLRRPDLVQAIESLRYGKALGNRWERQLDDRRVAAIDLLIPTYRSRARDTVNVGSVVTTEVPGLAEALRRPDVEIEAEFRLTNGDRLLTTIVFPDAVGTLAMKALVGSVRTEGRDAEDLWRCLEIAAADSVDPPDFDDESLRPVRAMLWRELGPEGDALGELTQALQPDAAAQLRTRVRPLLAELVGTD
jgi:hypothetical protein